MKTRDISQEFMKFTIKLKSFARMEMNRCSKKKHKSSCITIQQFRTMITLKKLEKCSLKDLSEKTHVSTSSLCIMLNKLSNDGLVYREIDSSDRRNTFYGLTIEGINILDEELENRLEYFDKIINKLNNEKKEILYKSLMEIESIVDELVDNETNI